MRALISQLLSQHFPLCCCLPPSKDPRLVRSVVVGSQAWQQTERSIWCGSCSQGQSWGLSWSSSGWLNEQNFWQGTPGRVGGTPSLRVERANSSCNSNDHSFPPEHSFSFCRIIVVPPEPYKCHQSHVSWRRGDLLLTSRIKFLSDIKGCHCCWGIFWPRLKDKSQLIWFSAPDMKVHYRAGAA